MDHAIVFIHVGPTLPPYTHLAVAQARLFNRCPIYLIANAAALNAFSLPADLNVTLVSCESLGLSERHREFHAKSTLDKSYREGFWTYTTERFFYFQTFMARYGLMRVLHLENDNLLYLDLETILPIFDANFPNLAGTFDNDYRCVPAFVWAHDAASFDPLLAFINDAFAKTTERLNDMVFLGEFGYTVGPRYFGSLPIVTRDYPRPLASTGGHATAMPLRYSYLIEELGAIFDANALGQYLGGIDPRNANGRNTVGFINESCLFDPSVYTYLWQTDDHGRRVPWVRSPAGNMCRIANLHIQSKNLTPFLSRV